MSDSTNLSHDDVDVAERVAQAVIRAKPDLSEDELTPNATFIADLGINSLETVEIVLAIEKEFDVSLSESDITKTLTMKDAVCCIRGKLGNGQRQTQQPT
jgi:acyl carrier protein